ncbi:MAG: Xaa-Pro aminopeptidase [Planctomycetota bacterium]|jgi:Xaa-Pro aminopeptidase
MKYFTLVLLSLLAAGSPLGDTVSKYGGVGDPSLVMPGARGVATPSTPEACHTRRVGLAAEIGDGIFLVQAGEEEDGRFDPDVDYQYLTGLMRPDSKLLLVAKNGKLVREELYIPIQTAKQKLWEGPKLGLQDFGPDSSFATVLPLENFDFEALAKEAGKDGVLAVDEVTIAELVEHEIEVKRGRKELNLLQKVKSLEEQAALQTAVDITLASLADATVIAVPGAWEYMAEAAIEGGFRRRGAEFLAFPSICGSGINSCYLHYRANNRQLQDGELLLMDVGAKYMGYSADITRTIPVNGKFSERQREIYTLVYDAQQLAAAALKPGLSMRDLHNMVVEFFDEKGYREYFKHGLGHHLGIRVHDVPGFRGVLEEGMLVTIEPGIYINEEKLGVRIEDDYLVTKDGSIKLSGAFPSAPDALEAYIARLRTR